jgi:hypothetical protein
LLIPAVDLWFLRFGLAQCALLAAVVLPNVGAM